jgi:gas vesicle protein
MTIEAELPDGTILEFPDGTSDQVIQNAAKSQLGIAEQAATIAPQEAPQPAPQITPVVLPVPQPQQQVVTEEPQQQITPTQQEPVEQQPDILQQAGQFAAENIPGFSAASEFAGGANEAIIELVDFFGTKSINDILKLTGSEARIPELGKTEFGQRVTAQALPEGLAQEVLRSAGKFSTSAVGFGGLIRGIAKELPRLSALAGGGVRTDIAAGAGAGVGAELGEEVGGETGRTIGSIVGAFAPGATLLAARETGRGILAKASPDIQLLKNTARDLYKRIDGLGVTVKPKAVDDLSKGLAQTVRKEGFNTRIHPKVSAALDEFGTAAASGAQTLSEIDILRRVAQSAAKSIEPDEARLGSIMINKIDDFLDGLGPANLTGGKQSDAGLLFKQARGLWGRARKGELLEEAFEKAGLQASGFENGIRVQFRSILNNKKKLKGFNKEEIAAMRKVVQGGRAENIAKALGRFGFTEGQSTSMLLGSLGVAGGAIVGGAPGAVAVPLLGQLSRNLAQRLTRKNAEFASQIVRAGKDGKKIAETYLKNTPKDQRSSEELTQILVNTKADLSGIKNSPNKIFSDSAFFAAFLADQNQEQ